MELFKNLQSFMVESSPAEAIQQEETKLSPMQHRLQEAVQAYKGKLPFHMQMMLSQFLPMLSDKLPDQAIIDILKNIRGFLDHIEHGTPIAGDLLAEPDPAK